MERVLMMLGALVFTLGVIFVMWVVGAYAFSAIAAMSTDYTILILSGITAVFGFGLLVIGLSLMALFKDYEKASLKVSQYNAFMKRNGAIHSEFLNEFGGSGIK